MDMDDKLIEKAMLNYLFKDIFKNPAEHRKECYEIMRNTLIVKLNKVLDGLYLQFNRDIRNK